MVLARRLLVLIFLLGACSGDDGPKGVVDDDAGQTADGGLGASDGGDVGDAAQDSGLIRPAGCGNGALDEGEECDDGNNRSGDGCDDFCRVEESFSCVVTGAACEECGNGIVESSEACDDGNRDALDGCDAACKIEMGWACPVADQPCELCGNGVIEPNERCDEGDFADGVGCTDDCRTVDVSFQCPSAGEACVECGDGVVHASEACDDGNVMSGDGCVFNCSAVELGWRCPQDGGTCTLCGNGIIEGDEACDDNNFLDGDGCSTSCEIEAGATCFFAGVLCSKCGNGFIEFVARNDNGTPNDTSDDFFDDTDPAAREACDDGNQDDGDGCSSSCELDDDGGSLPWLCPVPGVGCGRCGDGIVQPIEACDDGVNSGSGQPEGNDGCSADCTTIDPNFTCPATGGACALCGDGVVDAPLETCDDSGVLSGDGCNRLCQIETSLPWACPVAGAPCELCGNGIVEAHETCDDGNRSADDGCSADCMQVEPTYNCFFPGFPCARCGDGVLQAGEQCDEGQIGTPTNASGGCDATCYVVAPYSCTIVNQPCALCGDGMIEGVETCDDHNVASADGCSSVCQIEPGYDCASGSCLASACGDGFQAGNEECDDGNKRSGDGCNFVCDLEQGWSCVGAAGCRRTVCGDGVVEGEEECDDAAGAGPGCDAACRFEPGFDCPVPSEPCVATQCGDGVVAGYEQCDDGNATEPGCDDDCRLEPGFHCPDPGEPCLAAECGNGVLEGLEACDDADSASAGCDASCAEEPFYRCSGEPSVCKPIVEFVAIQRFNISNVSPAALNYDPDRRAFAGHKSQSSQAPIELCLDGTVIDPNDNTFTHGTIFPPSGGDPEALPISCSAASPGQACYLYPPRPVTSGTLVGSTYDPFTDHYLFITVSGNTTLLTDVPRDFDASIQDIADFQATLSGLSAAADLTVSEDGDLYVADSTTATIEVFPRRRDPITQDILVLDCALAPEVNCTTFEHTAHATRDWSAATSDVLSALFTVPGENLLGVFNAPAGATSYLGTDLLTGAPFTTSEYFTFFDPASLIDPPIYGSSALPGLLFTLGTEGTSYAKYGKSAETAADGGSFIICPLNPSEDCQLFARTCSDSAECAGIVPGTECNLTAETPYCHSPGDARDDGFSVDRGAVGVDAPIPLDVLANDSLSESACIDPNLTILSICGDGVQQTYELDHPEHCLNDELPRGNPVLTDGSVTYDAPDDGSCGFLDTFTYTVDLGGGVIDTATVRIVIACLCGDAVVDSNERCDQGGDNLPAGTLLDDNGTPAPEDDVYARCGESCFFNVFCGDGYIVFPEECDDRNTENGDGCSAFCTLESTCGDGIEEGAEQCDDGNSVGGDSCNANCTLPVCGDGNVDIQEGETCDDGNAVAGDGCNNSCQVETKCGNGNVELGEDCDDGGTVPGDGCSAICTVENICGNDLAETGEQCDGAAVGMCPVVSSVQIECTNAQVGAPNLCLCANYCGDGMIGGLEECDAGPSGSATCRGSSPSSGMPCTAIRCGDGIKDGVEQCDDGNTNPSDGCTNDCKVVAICGDGKTEGSEECDDSNNVSGDGCSSACKDENTVCGDNTLDFDEQCDDGNTEAGDGCGATCLREGGVCGDGTLDLGEQCDDKNTVSNDGCDAQCRLELCGNGVVDPGELCDDGARVSGDGCSANCFFELD